MDNYADRLHLEAADKNMIDKDEYPRTADIEERCVRILARERSRSHRRDRNIDDRQFRGLHARWPGDEASIAARGEDAGRSTVSLIIVMGSNVQAFWEKFAAYWDVEARYVPMEGDRYHMTAEAMMPYVDENTIGVVAILGSTMDGQLRTSGRHRTRAR